MIRHRPSWFTLIELIWAVLIISVALLTILGMLRVAVNFTNKSRQETVAINLAREGMEAVYHRRNTNRLKWSGERDKYWLCIDNNCSAWFQWGAIYKSFLGDSVGFVQWDTFNITDSVIIWLQDQSTYLLSWSYFLSWTTPDGADFYRGIIGIGLYQKDTDIVWWYIIDCSDWNQIYNGIDLDWIPFSSDCLDSRPKEFRFCSRVEYEDSKNAGQVELCGGISNYQE